MTWLAYIAGVLLVVRLMIVLSNLFSRHWLRPLTPRSASFVSILIPARNEEENLPDLLGDLLDLDYQNVEILVYDDNSGDRTAEIVREFSIRDPRIRLLEGVELPEGWMGKNHACHRLSQAARGDYLLFLDADVRVNPGLIRRSLAHMHRHKLSLLSIFPRQQMKTFGEWITVPLMNSILTSMLPMIMVRKSFRSSLAAANGQFMLFSAQEYRQHHFHELLKTKSVEDIQISRLMKGMGYNVDVLLSSGEVECRMYGDFRGALSGFSRYLLEFFGGSIAGLLLFILFTTFGIGFVVIGVSWEAAAVYAALTVLLRSLISIISRQSVLLNILFLPFQQVALLIMSFEAIRKKIIRRNTWKGRKIVTGVK